MAAAVRMWQGFSKPQHTHILILLLAFGLRLGWVLYSPALPTSDFHRYAKYGVRIAEGHGFSTPAGLTAFSPPLYPYFLGNAFALFGQYIIVIKLLQVGLGTLTVYLTYRLAAEMFDLFTAQVATFIIAIAPSLISYTALLATENVTLPLLVGSMYCFIVGLRLYKISWLVMAGCLLGLTTLSRAAFLLLPAAWAIYFVLTRHPLRPLFWVTLAMSVTLSPWVIRNYLVFDAFIPTSTNGGYNLLVSFSLASNGTWRERLVGNTMGSHFVWETTRLENGMSEVELDRQTRQHAFAFIRENPLAALKLTPLKFWLTMRDDVSGIQLNLQHAMWDVRPITVHLLRAAAQLHYLCALFSAIAGIWLCRSLSSNQAQYPYALLVPTLFLIALHAFFFGGDRFHLPILPFIYIYSGVAISRFFDKFDLIERLSVFMRRNLYTPT